MKLNLTGLKLESQRYLPPSTDDNKHGAIRQTQRPSSSPLAAEQNTSTADADRCKEAAQK